MTAAGTRCVCTHTAAAHPGGVCAPMFCECRQFRPAMGICDMCERDDIPRDALTSHGGFLAICPDCLVDTPPAGEWCTEHGAEHGDHDHEQEGSSHGAR